MYSDCGVFGYFRTFADADRVRHEAHLRGVCGEGTAWHEERGQCVASAPSVASGQHFAAIFDAAPRGGKCECNGLPVLTRTEEGCRARACQWTPWAM